MIRQFTTGNYKTRRRLNEIVRKVNDIEVNTSPTAIKRQVKNALANIKKQSWLGIITEGIGTDQIFKGTFINSQGDLITGSDIFTDVDVVCPIAEQAYTIPGYYFIATRKPLNKNQAYWFCTAIYDDMNLIYSSEFPSSEAFSSDLLSSQYRSSQEYSSGESLSSGWLPSSGAPLSTGDRSSGELSTGELSSNEISSGEQSTQEISSGELSSHEISSAEQSTAEISSADRSSGELSTGEISSGELSTGEISTGERSSAELSSGELSTGELSSRELSTGELSSGEYSSNQPSSDVPSSNAPSSDAVSSEDYYTCPDTITITVKDIENAGVDSCLVWCPSDPVATSINGTWTLTEQSECFYIYDDGVMRLSVEIDAVSGTIELKPCNSYGGGYTYAGDVHRGGVYHNQSELVLTRRCAVKALTGVVYIF